MRQGDEQSSQREENERDDSEIISNSLKCLQKSHKMMGEGLNMMGKAIEGLEKLFLKREKNIQKEKIEK